MINFITTDVTSSPKSLIKSDLKMSWENYISELKELVGTKVFSSWFSSCKFISLKASHLTFSVKNKFIQKWLEDHYKSYILSVCRKFQIATYQIIVNESNEIAPEVKKKDNDNLSVFDERYTFRNFVVSPSSNEIAYAAAYAIADSEYTNKRSNPLFIYGNVGLGKTHLMHAIGHHVQSKYPNKKVLYMSAEKFVQSFVQSLMNNNNSFRNLLRSVDILMVDDIQFICGKNKTQEEFFNTFNILLENSKQIIVSCDKPPSNLDKLEDRLKSRLAWGLTVDIHETNYELRLGILKSKVMGLNCKIDIVVLEFLAENLDTNVRELEGALNKIVMYSSLMKVDITLPVAKNIMKDIIKVKKESVSIEDIQAKVSHYYKINLKDMLSISRKKSFVKTRQIAMYLCKKLTNHSLVEISRKFDRKDHTTVLHAVQTIKNQYENDDNIRSQIDEMIDLFM